MKIIINNAGNRCNTLPIEQTKSYVSITLPDFGYTIFLASIHFNQKIPGIETFYADNNIIHNVDLSKLPHGDNKDTKDASLERFAKAADEMKSSLQKGKAILVNCNNGRSRTGAVVALYLMRHHGMNADLAIETVNSALEQRGIFNSIDLKNPINGSYGDWLRELDGKENIEESRPKRKRTALSAHVTRNVFQPRNSRKVITASENMQSSVNAP